MIKVVNFVSHDHGRRVEIYSGGGVMMHISSEIPTSFLNIPEFLGGSYNYE